MDIYDEVAPFTEEHGEALAAFTRQRRQEEAQREYLARVDHARAASDLDGLERISPERWAQACAVVREEREIAELRRQLGEAQ